MKVTPKQPAGHALGWCVHRGSRGTTQPGFQASFFVRATYSFGPTAPAELSPAENIVLSGDMPHEDAADGLRYPSDFVPQKPFGEVIVVGTAHPPAGQVATRYAVRVAVGAWGKAVTVHGDRAWNMEGLLDKPGPAGVAGPIPLSFAHAWGGAGVASNPLGLGAAGERVPNLELPDRPIIGRHPGGNPAGFGPIPPDWPQRKQHAGMPGKTGVASWWPWAPPQFDERFWMATLPDQWVKGYFRGDEPVELIHLHPEQPEWRTALPGQRARVFVLRLAADAPLSSHRPGRLADARATFEELPLVLDTLFIDADAGEMTLVWRGCTPVRSPKLLDILGVSFGLEPLGEHRDPQHYFSLLFAEENEAAAEPAPTGPAIRAEIEAAIAAGEAERARIVAEIEAVVAKAEETARAAIRDAEAAAAAERAKATAELAAGGFAAPLPFDLPDPAASASRGDAAEILKMAADLRASAAAAEVELPAAMQEAISEQAARLEEVAGLVTMAEGLPAEIEATIATMRAEIESAFPPGFLVNRVVKPGAVLDVEAIRRDSLAEFDIRGVDFSGLDLGGVSFRGAAAAEARFCQARLAGADFTGANLSGADLTGADLSGALLEDADLANATVAGARFAGARIGGANLRGLALAAADFTGVTGLYADFTGADLTAAVFREARLDKPDFTAVRAAGADFSGAVLTKADFGGAVCHGTIFDDASLPNLRAREAADFTGARLHRVRADDASWMTSILDRADFQDADLRRADFSECLLDGTNFDRCDLASAVFVDSTLHAAALTEANLLRTSFDRATIVAVRFDGSSLFEAGFWDATLVQATFAGATLDRVTLPAVRSGLA